MSGQADATTPPTLLAVDDDPAVLRFLVASLGREFHVVTAGSAGEAVAAYRSARPALVLLDVYMPDKGGVAALADLLAVDPSARCVLLTGDPDSLPDSLRAGSLGVVGKPVSPRALRAVVRGLLGPTTAPAAERRSAGRAGAGHDLEAEARALRAARAAERAADVTRRSMSVLAESRLVAAAARNHLAAGRSHARRVAELPRPADRRP